MALEIAVGDLRDRAEELVDRAAGGELITITRGGDPVALLGPARRRALTLGTLRERRRRLPPLDPWRLRRDLASALDDTL
jgi:prevent-host-death family protein